MRIFQSNISVVDTQRHFLIEQNPSIRTVLFYDKFSETNFSKRLAQPYVYFKLTVRRHSDQGFLSELGRIVYCKPNTSLYTSYDVRIFWRRTPIDFNHINKFNYFFSPCYYPFLPNISGDGYVCMGEKMKPKTSVKESICTTIESFWNSRFQFMNYLPLSQGWKYELISLFNKDLHKKTAIHGINAIMNHKLIKIPYKKFQENFLQNWQETSMKQLEGNPHVCGNSN